MGEASCAEYYTALRQLASHPGFPTKWWPPLLKYEAELSCMAINWDWATCRRWSEWVFAMVADGRLRRGWLDEAAIKDVQREICSDTLILAQQWPAYTLPDTRPLTSAYYTNPPPSFQCDKYNREVEGKACFNWNWG